MLSVNGRTRYHQRIWSVESDQLQWSRGFSLHPSCSLPLLVLPPSIDFNADREALLSPDSLWLIVVLLWISARARKVMVRQTILLADPLDFWAQVLG
jgi:hypothetical protein